MFLYVTTYSQVFIYYYLVLLFNTYIRQYIYICIYEYIDFFIVCRSKDEKSSRFDDFFVIIFLSVESSNPKARG